MQDATAVWQQAQRTVHPTAADLRAVIESMYAYTFGIATPELNFPMFGDSARPSVSSIDRSAFALFRTLEEASDLLGDTKYAALAHLDRDKLPRTLCYGFPAAAMYAIRSGWGP